MARRSLKILADIVGRDLASGADQLTKRAQRDLAVFARAIGVDANTFLGYAPSTRAKYVRAAKKGRTAQQERERVRAQRKVRAQAKKPAVVNRQTPQQDSRWPKVMYLRSELIAEGINVNAGPDTGVDSLGFDDLYDEESLVEHIKVYGFPYVLTRMEGQLDAIQQYNRSGGGKRTVGRARMQRRFGTLNRKDFAASDAVHDDDERWYWYHANSLHYGG